MARFDHTAGASGTLKTAALALLLLMLSGCGGTDDSGDGEFYTTWDEQGGCSAQPDRDPPWQSAAGGAIDPCDYPGQFVWVSYGALWCSASRSQAPHVRAAAGNAPADSRFIMNLTSGAGPFVPATVEDARSWAGGFGFDPAMVTTEGHSTRTIPQHALFGPDGRTWFRYVGMLRSDEILGLLDAFRRGERAPKRFD